MSDLLSRAVMAHGSLDRYNQFKTVSADLAVGGTLWELKGQLGRGNVHVIVDQDRVDPHAAFAGHTKE